MHAKRNLKRRGSIQWKGMIDTAAQASHDRVMGDLAVFRKQYLESEHLRAMLKEERGNCTRLSYSNQTMETQLKTASVQLAEADRQATLTAHNAAERDKRMAYALNLVKGLQSASAGDLAAAITAAVTAKASSLARVGFSPHRGTTHAEKKG